MISVTVCNNGRLISYYKQVKTFEQFLLQSNIIEFLRINFDTSHEKRYCTALSQGQHCIVLLIDSPCYFTPHKPSSRIPWKRFLLNYLLSQVTNEYSKLHRRWVKQGLITLPRQYNQDSLLAVSQSHIRETLR